MSYVDRISIWGLMNKNASLCTKYPQPAHYRVKSCKKISVYCSSPIPDESQYDEINYMYLDKDPNVKGSTCMDEIVSDIDSENYFRELPGREYREIRETRNKYINKIETRAITTDNYLDVLNMIEKWRYSSGMKYGWQEHAGIDKALIKRYIEDPQRWNKDVIMTSFWIEERCIGYSCIERNSLQKRENLPEYVYLTRKVLNDLSMRNITEYIDWWTFREIYRTNGDERFLVNWGCSSGGVHWYKTHKWKLYSLTKKWFYKYKREK